MGHRATWKLGPYPYKESDPLWEKIAYDFLHDLWRKDYNTCAECGSTKLFLKNYDIIWGDGDLICENGHRVRMFDRD